MHHLLLQKHFLQWLKGAGKERPPNCLHGLRPHTAFPWLMKAQDKALGTTLTQLVQIVMLYPVKVKQFYLYNGVYVNLQKQRLLYRLNAGSEMLFSEKKNR
jgi:hypothetical protein